MITQVRSNSVLSRILLLLVATGASSLWAQTGPSDASLVEGIPNGRGLPGDVVVGGQPSESWLGEAAADGYRYIVDLRGPDEDRGFDEQGTVLELGMEYLAIPITGSEDLNTENATKLEGVLERQRSTGGGVLIHCAGGNRVGALFAVRAFHHDGISVEEALEQGTEAGMTGLEGAVRNLLQAADPRSSGDQPQP